VEPKFGANTGLQECAYFPLQSVDAVASGELSQLISRLLAYKAATYQNGVPQYPSAGNEETDDAELAVRGNFGLSFQYAPVSRSQLLRADPQAIQMLKMNVPISI
jgi:hypothetical protein